VRPLRETVKGPLYAHEYYARIMKGGEVDGRAEPCDSLATVNPAVEPKGTAIMKTLFPHLKGKTISSVAILVGPKGGVHLLPASEAPEAPARTASEAATFLKGNGLKVPYFDATLEGAARTTLPSKLPVMECAVNRFGSVYIRPVGSIQERVKVEATYL